jgi:hypothetical protein
LRRLRETEEDAQASGDRDACPVSSWPRSSDWSSLASFILTDQNHGSATRHSTAIRCQHQTSFIYGHHNRHLLYPEKRIDAVLALQQPDGHWDKTNRTWLTLDAIYMMTRTVRYCPYRIDDVQRAVRRSMETMMVELFSPEGRKKSLSPTLPMHSVTCAVSIVAEAQQFLGPDQVITEWPLHLVLDRRPLI